MYICIHVKMDFYVYTGMCIYVYVHILINATLCEYVKNKCVSM